MSGAHNLHRLALAAVRRAPYRPLIACTDGITGPPELRSNARIGRILEETPRLAVLDLIRQLYAKLEVKAAIIDTPTLVDAHINAMYPVPDSHWSCESWVSDSSYQHEHSHYCSDRSEELYRAT